MLKWNEVARHFYLFEEQYADSIGRLTVEKYNTWSIVKAPLYRHLIKNKSGSEEKFPGRSFTRKFFSLAKRLTSIIFLLLGIIKIFLKRRVNSVLFYTLSADKLAKIEGRYYNFLVDGFITEEIVRNYLYMEHSYEGDFRKPSSVPTDFKLDFLPSIGFLYKPSRKKREEIRKAAQALSEIFEDYFKSNGIDFGNQVDIIETILVGFFVEYKLNAFLLRIVKPALMITSERPGTGLLAAAIEQNIKTIDLQHGLIDEYHPLYQYSGKLQAVKKQMLMPTYVGVFGEFHKSVFLKSSFWSSDEIIVLGSGRIEQKRKAQAGNSSVNQSKVILFPTQWTVFEETKSLLSAIANDPGRTFKIMLKPHPLESNSNIEYYRSIQAQNKEWLEIANSESDVYHHIFMCRAVLGFDSTTLLEAISFGVPGVSISLPSMPKGIHTLLGTDHFLSAIKFIPLQQISTLVDLLNKVTNDDVLYNNWKADALSKGKELYAENYYENIRDFIISMN